VQWLFSQKISASVREHQKPLNHGYGEGHSSETVAAQPLCSCGGKRPAPGRNVFHADFSIQYHRASGNARSAAAAASSGKNG